MATRKKKAEQTEIPGTEKPVHKDVARKATQLYETRAERMELSEREAKLAGELLELMRKHGIDSYTEDDMVVQVVPAEAKVKVKKKREADE